MRIFKCNISFNVNTSEIRAINWRPFIVGFMVGCFGALMTQRGWVPKEFLNPIPNTFEIFDSIKPKLHERVNYFKLKRKRTFIPVAEAATTYNEASAYAAVDLDTGSVIVEKRASDKLPVASITKIMAGVVSLDLASPEDVFTVSKNAQRQIPTKIGLTAGQRLTLYELLHAALLTSANDATEVIRESIDHIYGKKVFIEAMNEKARFVGLKNTHFSNPQGFDNAENYSSAEDVAVLSAYALSNYPLIREIVKKDFQYIPANQTHKRYDLYNWNGLLGVYPNISGVKIGNTDDAGIVSAVVSQREGKKIVAVILGAPDIKKRDLWAAELLDSAYEKTLDLPPVEVTEDQLLTKYSTWKFW